MPTTTQAIVLAAGKSSRFSTSSTKLSYTLCGQEMIRYPLNLLRELHLPITMVVGYQQDVVRSIVSKYGYHVEFVEQSAQKGTGHALACTQSSWTHDKLLIINGDTPLVSQEQLLLLLERHRVSGATLSLIASRTNDPEITGYGRIIKDGVAVSIVEQRDFTGDPTDKNNQLLNGGIYLIDRSFVEQELPRIPTHGSGEIFITDLIHAASAAQKHIEILEIPFTHIRGINTLKELQATEGLLRKKLIEQWMAQGVRFIAPESVIVDIDVSIGQDTTIGYGVHLRSGTHIGKKVTIDSFSILDGAHIEDEVTVYSHSVISHSLVHEKAFVGPFARIHRQTTIHQEAVVGNFVELSKTSLGSLSKAKHLTYLGQAKIGKQVTIGAGTITCNYNGVTKHSTTVEDNAFIGSNSALIAPITIGKEAIIAAGSTITESVPNQALAIARQRQVNKPNYAPLLKSKHRSTPEETSSELLKTHTAPQGS